MSPRRSVESLRRKATPTSVPAHQFAVDGMVVFKTPVSGAESTFRITRLLPDGGQGLQYRIRSERDGHERVVLESIVAQP